MKLQASVLILTKNEEHDLPGCLKSVAGFDDIVVFDSYSTDNTQIIATNNGARVVYRPDQDPSIAFGGDEASHRTWGLREIVFKHSWLLVLDADERLSLEASRDIGAILERNSHGSYQPDAQPVAYQIRRRDFMYGRHLKHVQATPLYVRFFRPEFIHYERVINPVTVVNGQIGQLNGWINHYPFSKGISYWIERHNAYSSFEARQVSQSVEPVNLKDALFCRDFNRRRRFQKRLFMQLPARPILKFIILYFLKGGFLDGRPGFVYAILQSIYEYFIVLKIRERNDVISRIPALTISSY